MTRESEGLSEEDRATISELIAHYAERDTATLGVLEYGEDAGALTRALSHIEHLEECVARADELAQEVSAGIDDCGGGDCICHLAPVARAYQATRNPKEEG